MNRRHWIGYQASVAGSATGIKRRTPLIPRVAIPPRPTPVKLAAYHAAAGPRLANAVRTVVFHRNIVAFQLMWEITHTGSVSSSGAQVTDTSGLS